MSIGSAFAFPEEMRELHRRIRRLSWLSIVLLFIAGTLIFLTVGQSQAMKTAWISDILTAVPPMALLVALRYELRPPSKRFPSGYTRAVSVAFLVTASILSIVGLYLLYDSLTKLLRREHPPIGTIELFGSQFWLGWAMLVTLFLSMCVGITLGKLKTPVAKKLQSKALQAEAEMNQAEWMSEGAAILGILLVAFGFWWGDAAAAAFISIEIIRDGWHNVRQVIGDLMDEAPTKLGKKDLEDLPDRVAAVARRLPWVTDAGARLREHGHAVTGEIFIVPRPDSGMDAAALLRATEDAARQIGDVDWRLHGLAVVPVTALESTIPPRVGHDGASR
ncbi:MAG TPA: cation transporter [Gemmatimonadaceae bacterium]